MAFVDDLRVGTGGLQFQIPDTFKILKEFPQGINLEDSEHHVNWHVARHNAMLDLRRENDSLLQSDIRAFARAEFDAFHEQNGKGVLPPRTAAPAWSSVVEVEYVEIGSAPALYVLRRLAYGAGHEIVIGHVSIPGADSTHEFSASCRAGMTGVRESVLFNQLRGSQPDVPFEETQKILTSEYIDDPAHDSQFPDHPLSLARAACRWLRHSAGVEVTMPMPKISPGEVSLANIGCVVTPPPRYVFSPGLSKSMERGHAVFTRIALPGAARYLSVWQVPDVRIRGWDRRRKLEQFAERTIQAWEREGVSEIKIDAQALPDQDGRLQVATYTRFRAMGDSAHAAARWFIDSDRDIFNVEVSGPLFVSKDELVAEVDAVVNSWRRL